MEDLDRQVLLHRPPDHLEEVRGDRYAVALDLDQVLAVAMVDLEEAAKAVLKVHL